MMDMAVCRLAWAEIKKKKSVAVSMGILILLAVAMFDVGLTLLTGTKSFYDEENDRLAGAHYTVRFSNDEYDEEYLDYLMGDERVEAAQTSEIVLMDMAGFPEGGVISSNFKRLDDQGPIKGYRITEQIGASEDMAAYVPVFFKDMGYDLGDHLTLEYNKEQFVFQIIGFTQSTWFHSSVSSLVDIYVPDQTFDKLFEKVGGGYVLMARVKDLKDVEAVREDFKENTDVNIQAVSMSAEVMDFSINEMRQGCTMVVTLLSAVLFVFSILMVLVAVIVMRFRILNHIESQMVNIGVLSALGYTKRQIKWSIALEFLIIGLAGTILGVAASYGMIAGLGGLITSSMGVAFRGGGHAGCNAASVSAIMGTVLLVASRTAGKATAVQPVQALRGGLKTHSFDRSYAPLEHTRGRLSAVLGFKNMIFQKKTYAMVGAIFAGIAFACGFAVIIYWNMGLNQELVLKFTGYEISDIIVYQAPHADYESLAEEIEGLSGVRKTSMYQAESARVEGELLTCYLSDDYGRLEMVDVYEGSFPMYDNEIVITGVLSKAWGKRIGDTVTVRTDQAQAEYVICGLSQTMSNFGRQCFISLEGMRRVDPLYQPDTIQVYLEPGIDIEEYVKTMEAHFKVLSPSASVEDSREADAARRAEEKLTALLSSYGVDSAQYALMADGEIVLCGDMDGYVIDRIENNRKMFVSNVDSIAASVSIMSVIILTGTFFMITLVLYMVIKSMLVRQKREFGIYKALGYTDRQLMEMIAMSFLPASAAGTLLGGMAACAGVNPIASHLFEMLGISRLELTVNPWLMAGTGVAVVAAAFAISTTVARRIKGITVCGLLTEE